MWDGSLKYDEAYNRFNENMKFTLREDDELLSMKNVEIVSLACILNIMFVIN